MFTNWSRPPLGEQVTHCRGMHNLPMNCCIFCLLYLHFSKEKKKQVFPDKDIFCFWWMKLVCISLETANEFILGTGMKPLICFTWVPSDGKKKKKNHFVPYCWSFNHWRMKWPKVWYPTTSSVEINSICSNILTVSDCYYCKWQLDLYIFVFGKNTTLLWVLYLAPG